MNKLIFNFIFIFCLATFSQGFAYEGKGAIADCGSESFMPGDLPSPEECTYPNVGTMMADLGAGVFEQICNASLIYKDEHKAVLVSAAHCVNIVIRTGGTNYLTFEPQPSIPYSLFPPAPFRPLELTQNLIPVASTIGHPLYLNTGNFGHNNRENDLGVLLLDTTIPEVAAALEGLEPLSIPPVVNYLNSFKSPELLNAKMTFVGYSRLTSDAIVTDDASFKPSNQKDLVPAQHNRKYGPASYQGLQTSFLHFAMMISKDGTIGCYGDSGSPVLLENGDDKMILGVYSLFFGNRCNQSAANYYARFDIQDNYTFLQCAVDPNLSIEQVSECIDNAF